MTKQKQNKQTNQQVQALTNKIKQLNVAMASQTKTTQKPFRKVGGKIGNIFGPLGKTIGKGAGSLVGALFGSGDYYTPLPPPAYNSIINNTQQPRFVSKTTDQNVTIIRKREFIQDVTVAAGGEFSVTSYVINAGKHNSFPFLASIAQHFEQYKIHGMVYEFNSLCADSVSSVNASLGSVIMATQYDIMDTPFANKQQMSNYDLSQSAKPSRNQMHGVECARKYQPLGEYFVRTGANPPGSDSRFYDHGLFSIATVGLSNSAPMVVGELYVTYEIELIKPKLPQTVGGTNFDAHLKFYGANNANPFGSTSVVETKYDTLGVSRPTGNTIAVSDAIIGSGFMFTVLWIAGTGVTWTHPSISFGTGCKNRGISVGPGNQWQGCPGNGLPGVTFASLVFWVTATAPQFNVSLNGDGVVPGNSSIDLFITEIDSTSKS